MDFVRDFKGVWIPREIWLNEELTMLEKGILTEIDSLDNGNGCFASNAYMAKFCQCGERTITSAIKKLKDKGLIEVKEVQGVSRTIYSRVERFATTIAKTARGGSKNCEGGVAKTATDIHNTDNNRGLTENIKETPKESGNIAQEVIDFFNEHRGQMPRVTKLTAQRRSAIMARLRDGTLDEIKQVIMLAEVSAFLQGRKTQWQATFDWLMKPSNFVKVLEGNYNKDECEKPNEKTETEKMMDFIFGGGE